MGLCRAVAGMSVAGLYSMPKFVACFRGRCAPQCKRLTDYLMLPSFRDEDHSFQVHISGALEEFLLVYVLSNESRLRIVSISRVIAGLIMIIIS